MADLAVRISRNLFWSLLSEVIAKLLPLAAIILVARNLQDAAFGKIAFAQAVITFLFLAVDSGLSAYGWREVAKEKGRSETLLIEINSLRLLFATIATGLLLLFALLAGLSSEMIVILLGTSTWMIGNGISPDWLLRGWEKINYLTALNLFVGTLYVLLVIFVVKGPQDAIAASFLRGGAFLAGSLGILPILARYHNIKFRLKVSLSLIKAYLREIVAIGLGQFLVHSYLYIGSLFLWFFRTPAEVGQYEAAFRLAFMLMAIANINGIAFFPVLCDLYKRDRSSLQRVQGQYFRIMAVIGIPLGVGGTLLAEKIILTLYGWGYAQAAPIFQMLVWLVVLTFLRHPFSAMLLAANLQRWHALASGAGLALGLALSSLLVPIYGVHGAALSLIGAEILIAFLSVLLLNMNLYRYTPLDFYFLRVALAGLLMGLILKLIPALNLFESLALGLASYLLIALSIGLIKKRELAYLGRAFYSFGK